MASAATICSMAAAANDLLIGGSGADTFVYAAGYGNDTIADFNHSDGDRIDLTGVSRSLFARRCA